MRVVSLIPAATEIVHALGAGDALVGRSHECDHPPGVRALPALTAPKYEPDGASYAIDEEVRGLVQEGLSVYRVDAGALDRLRPELIVTQDQCEVCAVSLAEVEAAVHELVASRPRVVSLAPGDLGDVFRDVRRVGSALGRDGSARALIRQMKGKMRYVSRRVPSPERGPSVALVEWMEPLMGAGNWMPELVERAGGRHLFGKAGAHSPRLEWDELRAADPEVIVVMPCGFTVERTRREVELLTGREGWRELRAVRAGRVALADGHAFFNRPGPRLSETVEILAEILHPGRVKARHRGRGWVPLAA